MAEVKLPENLHIMNFASSRMNEIMTLSTALETKHGPKRVYQTLPRNLRRRAMSYNVKRMPRHLREQHKQELLNQGRKQPSKRPSRKYRRRPKRLLEEYERRKTEGKNTWLETHIWHAKRFKMSNLWGYKIPIESCLKNKRQIYRTLTNGSTIEDISYYNCLELKGKQKTLLDGLCQLTNTECGETFKSQNAITGEREGKTFLYKSNCYPYNAIGPVKFLWKLLNEVTDESERIIWIWVHPSTHDDILSELINVFKLSKNEKRKLSDDDVTESAKKRLKTDKDVKKNENSVLDTRVSHLMKSTNEVDVYIGVGIVLSDLKDTLIRFRLSGPQSTRILGNVLHIVDLKDDLSVIKSKMWNEMSESGSLTELTPRCVLGLDVRDPRLLMSVKEKMLKENTFESSTVIEIVKNSSQSRLWDKKIRDQVTFGKFSDEYINKIRSNCAVPGLNIDLGEDEPHIPIILIQNPGNRNSGFSPLNFGAGWDLILPCGWAMPFWISLIYNSAIPISLNSSRVINTAQCLPFFPHDFPDTAAGVRMIENEKNELMDRDLKRPPAKRVNYGVLKIASPYSFPWKELIKNYEDSNKNSKEIVDDFYVLRNRQKLKMFNLLLHKQQIHQQIDFDSQKSNLIFVQLKPIAKGIVDRLALICLPTENDLTSFRLKSYSTIKEQPKPKTKPKPDESVKKKFAKCRKERKTIRRKLKNSTDENEIKELKNRLEQIKPDLQLPDYTQNTNISESCSRNVIGFVTSCQFQLNVGEVVALGYCVDTGLKQLLNNQNNIVLLRKKTSLNYVFAKINILYDF